MWGISGLSEELLASQKDSAACSQLFICRTVCTPVSATKTCARCLSAGASYEKTHLTALFKKLLVSYGTCIRITLYHTLSQLKPCDDTMVSLLWLTNDLPVYSQANRSVAGSHVVRSGQSAISASVCKQGAGRKREGKNVLDYSE
jgi:hypothetical protein